MQTSNSCTLELSGPLKFVPLPSHHSLLKYFQEMGHALTQSLSQNVMRPILEQEVASLRTLPLDSSILELVYLQSYYRDMISSILSSLAPQSQVSLNSDRHNPERLELLTKLLNLRRILKFLKLDHLVLGLKLDLAQDLIEIWIDFRDMWDTLSDECLSLFAVDDFQIFTHVQLLAATFLQLMSQNFQQRTDTLYLEEAKQFCSHFKLDFIKFRSEIVTQTLRKDRKNSTLIEDCLHHKNYLLLIQVFKQFRAEGTSAVLVFQEHLQRAQLNYLKQASGTSRGIQLEREIVASLQNPLSVHSLLNQIYQNNGKYIANSSNALQQIMEIYSSSLMSKSQSDIILKYFSLFHNSETVESALRRSLILRLNQLDNNKERLIHENEELIRITSLFGRQFTRRSESVLQEFMNATALEENIGLPAILKGSVFIMKQSMESSLHSSLILRCPKPMEEIKQTLESRYKLKFKERKLEVSYFLGRVHLVFKRNTLVVAPIQAAILLHISDKPLSLESLHLCLTDSSDQNHYITHNVELLRQRGFLNLDNGSHYHLQIPNKTTDISMISGAIYPKDSKIKKFNEEKKETGPAKAVFESIIIKIMKEKRRTSHADLMNEVGVRMRHPVESVALKKTIEGLISRDFLERDEDDRK